MSKRSLIALVVVLAIAVPLALGGIAIVMGGGGERIVGALRADEYERAYGTNFYVETSAGTYHLGQPRSVTGCGSHAGLTTAPGPNGGVTKEPTTPAAQPCVLRLAAGRMPAAFFDLLDEVLAGQAGRTDFWLVNFKRDGSAANGLHIDDALMEVTFGKLDADTLDEQLDIVLSLRPDSVVELATCCSTFSPTQGGSAGSAGQQVYSNRFGASISGVAGGQDIVEITEWTIKQVASGTDISTELGDLTFTVMRHPTNGFRQWLTNFGQTPAAEKTMTIDVKRGSISTTNIAFTLSLTGVGIRGHEPLGWYSSGTAGQVLRDRFTVYVEGATAAGGFSQTAQPASAPPPPPPSPPTAPPTAPPPPPPSPPTTPPSPPPPPPTETELLAPADVKVERGEPGTVTLSWAEVKGAESYVILSSKEPGGPHEPLAETRETRHTISRLEPGTTIYLVLRAARGEGQSKNSEEIVVEIG